jgi:mycothiol S-conjugate amidase
MPKTLLALHAHPDDESSKGAATVAKYVSQGVRAILVTATGGEAGDILNPAMDTPEVLDNLPEVRASELAEAAKIIGYDDVVLLGHRDSGMPDSGDNRNPAALCRQPFGDVLESLVGIVRSEQPEVVLGYDAHEFYPHPDHLMVHRLSMALVDAAASDTMFRDAGDPWQIQKLYAPVFTMNRITTLHRLMLESTGESPFEGWLDRLEGLADGERRITQIDVTGYTEQGRNALRAHRTQVDPDGFWFAVPIDLLETGYPWEDFELLYSAVSWSADESDLFAGLG